MSVCQLTTSSKFGARRQLTKTRPCSYKPKCSHSHRTTQAPEAKITQIRECADWTSISINPLWPTASFNTLFRPALQNTKNFHLKRMRPVAHVGMKSKRVHKRSKVIHRMQHLLGTQVECQRSKSISGPPLHRLSR